MPEEKEIIRLTIEISKPDLEALKSQLRSGGGNQPLSATEAIGRAIKAYQSWARSVRLDEPERKEIESRAGATTPLRSSKDILRAFDRVSGGPDAVVVELDPSIMGLMKDVGRGLGFGLAEFCRIVIEDAYASAYMHTVELKPLFFTSSQWKLLLEITKSDRVQSAEALLSILRKEIPAETDLCPSTSSSAATAS